MLSTYVNRNRPGALSITMEHNFMTSIPQTMPLPPSCEDDDQFWEIMKRHHSMTINSPPDKVRLNLKLGLCIVKGRIFNVVYNKSSSFSVTRLSRISNLFMEMDGNDYYTKRDIDKRFLHNSSPRIYKIDSVSDWIYNISVKSAHPSMAFEPWSNAIIISSFLYSKLLMQKFFNALKDMRSRKRTLAFAMATHPRLLRPSPVAPIISNLDPEIMQMIHNFAIQDFV